MVANAASEKLSWQTSLAGFEKEYAAGLDEESSRPCRIRFPSSLGIVYKARFSVFPNP